MRLSSAEGCKARRLAGRCHPVTEDANFISEVKMETNGNKKKIQMIQKPQGLSAVQVGSKGGFKSQCPGASDS